MKKNKKPVSRKFWSYLRFLPTFLRAPFLRSQFEIPQELPADLVLKQAETDDEITAALRLVYDSYLELNYIDPNAAQLRLTKYHLLPTTVILVVKRKSEVIGTLSIIMDTSMKLPSDATWDLSQIRKHGLQIAEISSLTIKKNELGRGKLLMPLCKLMYLYCKNLLKLDGIIVSTTLEVENFYTDVLLFEKVVLQSGQRNKLVKGNPSTCCFLSLTENVAEEKYKKVYNNQIEKFNLYQFFVKKITPNIKLPVERQCLQSYTMHQTRARAKIVQQYPELVQALTLRDRLVIANLDVGEQFLFSAVSGGLLSQFRAQRYEVRQKARCFFSETQQMVEIVILNISETGLRIGLPEHEIPIKLKTTLTVSFSLGPRELDCEAEIVWNSSNATLGCKLKSKNNRWIGYCDSLSAELNHLAA